MNVIVFHYIFISHIVNAHMWSVINFIVGNSVTDTTYIYTCNICFLNFTVIMQAVVSNSIIAIYEALFTASRKHNCILTDKSNLAIFNKIIFAAHIDSTFSRIFNRTVYDFTVFTCNHECIVSCTL